MGLPGTLSFSAGDMGYLPHASILIDNNSGFVPSNGVTGGSGTPDDPYVIEGWEIAGQATAIEIRDTTAYLVIRNVYLHSNMIGVHFLDMSHGRLESSLLVQNTDAVGIDGSSGVTVTGNNITEYYQAVDVSVSYFTSQASSDVSIANNTISKGQWGISTAPNPHISGVNITSNTIWANSQAAVEVSSASVRVARNNITANGDGIRVSGTVNDEGVVLGTGVIAENRVSFNRQGLVIYGAVGITLADNILLGNGVRISAPSKFPAFFDSHTIPPTNLIDGKPLFYLSKCHDVNIDRQVVSELIVASCDNVKVAKLQVQNALVAIQMAFVHNATIGEVDLRNNYDALQILWSDTITIGQNHFLSNNGTALSIQDSGNITLNENSFISNLQAALVLSRTTNLTVYNNTVLSNQGAVQISESSSAFIAGNSIRGNRDSGFILTGAANTTILANSIVQNGGGISITSGNGLNITGNNIAYNGFGIGLFAEGIAGVFNTVVYHNNFAFNIYYQGSHDISIIASWDNGYPVGGNYWSDYTDTDNCSGQRQDVCQGPDGIADSPYRGLVAWQVTSYGGRVRTSSSLADHYPLVNPHGNFTGDIGPPSWPSGAALTHSTVNSTSIIIRWPAATDDTWVHGYRLFQNGTVLAEVAGNAYEYTVTGLGLGVTYIFKVEAGDPANNWSTAGPYLSLIITGPVSEEPPASIIDLLVSGLLQGYPYIILGVATVTSIVVIRRSKRTRKTDQTAQILAVAYWG